MKLVGMVDMGTEESCMRVLKTGRYDFHIMHDFQAKRDFSPLQPTFLIASISISMSTMVS